MYGPQDDNEKIVFLQELRDVRALCSGPWVIAGDFNLIYQASNKNNNNLNRAIMGRFRRFLDDVEVKEIPSWVGNTLGLMNATIRRLCAWIEHSVLQIGRIFFQTQSYRVLLLGSLIIAPWFWASKSVERANADFILRAFG